ncbi:helix-turn-helix domain-containing protein [Micromonospora sp. DT44]|uniref:helix-turn-helix domain-containing protein n=1 Tax=Micromonospora sp. DT44 TaxID=3393439 RepID=UPI003CEF8FA4
MPPRTTSGSTALASAIRERRIALNLSIDEAAAKAGVGAKSWSRYESGAAIRRDKVRGVCRALGWSKLPGDVHSSDKAEDDWLRKIDQSHDAWSEALNELYSQACATTFAVGSDLVHDHLADDLRALAEHPRGTHLGQLAASWFDGELPPQFLPRYDYEFVYELRAAVIRLRRRFAHGDLVAHTVLEELALYLIFEEAELLADMSPALFDEEEDDWREWLAGILGDTDVELLLFTSDLALTPDVSYHFDHWNERQFYVTEGGESTEA